MDAAIATETDISAFKKITLQQELLQKARTAIQLPVGHPYIIEGGQNANSCRLHSY
ncbi:MAG: hypothetical protein F6J92_35070 [Symploca sp. SIO1A3]|nr:hypothetical protein [Symploca sp. SIO1A3]